MPFVLNRTCLARLYLHHTKMSISPPTATRSMTKESVNPKPSTVRLSASSEVSVEEGMNGTDVVLYDSNLKVTTQRISQIVYVT